MGCWTHCGSRELAGICQQETSSALERGKGGGETQVMQSEALLHKVTCKTHFCAS